MPHGFVVMTKERKDGPMGQAYFDAKSEAACEQWLAFLRDGPRWDGLEDL